MKCPKCKSEKITDLVQFQSSWVPINNYVPINKSGDLDWSGISLTIETESTEKRMCAECKFEFDAE